LKGRGLVGGRWRDQTGRGPLMAGPVPFEGQAGLCPVEAGVGVAVEVWVSGGVCGGFDMGTRGR
jgi:hypothetical protein